MTIQSFKLFSRLLFSFFVLTSVSCSNLARLDLPAMQHAAKKVAFSYSQIDTSHFSLVSFQKINFQSKKEIHIYIEGDGFSWANAYRPSKDPTPKNSLVFQLALADPAQSVIYLARPCQYLLSKNKIQCTPSLWTSHRYSSDVVKTMSEAIDQVSSSLGSGVNIHLFGYSGGGALAALLTAQRQDISRLITINANLDHLAWTQYHHDTSLFGSENPVSIAKDIALVPQLHFFGTEDKIVPFITTQSFFEQHVGASNSHVQSIDSFDHSCCWLRDWPILLERASRIIGDSQ